MKKTTLYLASFIASCSAFSQEVISIQGDSYQGTNATVDFTIGEAVIFTGSDGNNTITQGFHQTKWEYAGIENYEDEIDLTVYPNPVPDDLTINSPDYLNKMYTVFDATGKMVSQGRLLQEKTLVKTSHWATGGYTIVISNDQNVKIKSIKLIKKH